MGLECPEPNAQSLDCNCRFLYHQIKILREQTVKTCKVKTVCFCESLLFFSISLGPFRSDPFGLYTPTHCLCLICQMDWWNLCFAHQVFNSLHSSIAKEKLKSLWLWPQEGEPTQNPRTAHQRDQRRVCAKSEATVGHNTQVRRWSFKDGHLSTIHISKNKTRCQMLSIPRSVEHVWSPRKERTIFMFTKIIEQNNDSIGKKTFFKRTNHFRRKAACAVCVSLCSFLDLRDLPAI